MKSSLEANVKILLSQGLANISMKTARFIRVTFKKVNPILRKVLKMEMGFTNFRKESFSKVSLKIIRLKDLEFSFGRKVLIIKGGGKIAFFTVMVNILIVMGISLEDFTKMIKDQVRDKNTLLIINILKDFIRII